jgi:hypothetical protein
MKTKEAFLSELTRVRRPLEAWRKTRKPPQPIPERLWRQIATLAGRHGVSAVCQALRLDYYGLKRRVGELSKAAPPLVSPEFVELKFPPSDGTAACVAQLEDGRGGKLTVRWAAAPSTELLGLIQGFWKERA